MGITESNLTLQFLTDFASKYLSQQQRKCPLPKGKPDNMYFYSFVGSRAFIEINYNLHALPSNHYLYLYKNNCKKNSNIHTNVEITHSLKYLYLSKMYAPTHG